MLEGTYYGTPIEIRQRLKELDFEYAELKEKLQEVIRSQHHYEYALKMAEAQEQDEKNKSA